MKSRLVTQIRSWISGVNDYFTLSYSNQSFTYKNKVEKFLFALIIFFVISLLIFGFSLLSKDQGSKLIFIVLFAFPVFGAFLIKIGKYSSSINLYFLVSILLYVDLYFKNLLYVMLIYSICNIIIISLFYGKKYQLIFSYVLFVALYIVLVEKIMHDFVNHVITHLDAIQYFSVMVTSLFTILFYKEVFKGYENEKILIEDLRVEKSNLLLAKKEAEKANRAKSDFLSNMSHEIRTPMNGIVGFTEVLIERESDQEKLRYLQIIKESSGHLLNIINDILSLSKIEAGMYRSEKEVINVYNRIGDVIKVHQKQVELKGLEFKVNLSKDLDREVLIDFSSLLKILNNLLSNALKFTKSGYVLLQIANADNSRLEILVEDTGIGINEEKQKKLFVPFEQGEHFLTKQYVGTGLGLTIIKQLVDLMEGQIIVDTEVGKGTSIKVYLPYSTKDDVSINSNPTTTKGLVNKMVKIISADDVEINQKILEISLRNECALFKKVANGRELLDELENESYDLILMDIQMPVINGLKASKIIKSNPKLKSIPIIAVTAYALEENVSLMYSAGVDDHIPKPVNREELLQKINKWTANSR